MTSDAPLTPPTRWPFRLMLMHGGMLVCELLLVRALDRDGMRVFHAFGPAGQPYPSWCQIRLESVETGEELEGPDIGIRMQLYMDLAGVSRFRPLHPVWMTNN